MKDGRYLKGIELLKQVQQQLPYDQRVRQDLLFSYLRVGKALLLQQRFVEAADLLLEAQEFADEQREFWTMRGYALLRLKKYSEAETDLQEARGMGEADSQILYLLGKLYYDTDRMFEAVDVLESAMQEGFDGRALVGLLEKARRELAVEEEMDKEYGGHFVITYDGESNDELGADVLEVLEDAYNWVGSQLDHYPDGRVTVIIYTRRQFSELTDSPEWSGGLYDGKIRLPVGGVSRLDERIRALLYHEYMHVVLRDIAGRNLPYWLNEGLAEVAEAHIIAPQLDQLLQARQEQKLFSLKSLEKPFSRFKGQQAALAYQQSYSVVNFLIDEYGWHHARDLVFALGRGVSIGQAVDETLGDYDLSYQTFEEYWREAG